MNPFVVIGIIRKWGYVAITGVATILYALLQREKRKTEEERRRQATTAQQKSEAVQDALEKAQTQSHAEIQDEEDRIRQGDYSGLDNHW